MPWGRRATVREDARLWIAVHVPRPLAILALAGMIAELTVGFLPVALPWVLNVDVKLGLLLPLATVSAAVSMLHSGLGAFESRVRHRWWKQRLIWCLAVGTVITIPAIGANDSLNIDGSLRNRLIIFAITVLSSLVLPPGIAILPAALLLLFALLAAGVIGPQLVPGGVLSATTSASQWAGTTLLVVAAALIYAFRYPGITSKNR